MTFNRESYKMTRKDTLQVFKDYIEVITHKESIDWDVVKKKEALLALSHNELLIIQSSSKRWEQLLNNSDVNFRRAICAKLFNLERVDIMRELNLSDGAVSNLFNKATMPVWPRPFQLSVLLDHPWQLINKENPVPYSYSESPEYFNEGVSKHVHLKDLSNERFNVRSIYGYVILNPQELFQQESRPIAGRWVTTYPEFDYFEFHLNYEPLIDKVIRKGILELFPQAKHMITTFRPFKPTGKRSIWIIIPKKQDIGSYQGIIHELKEYRDDTEYHLLQ